MITKTVYQTLEDRETDLNKLESEGPYKCNWKNSWLGDGYYFWDTFIENAHWWGEEGRQYEKGYIICEATCDFSTDECLDLAGSTEHIQQFHDTFSLLKKKGLANQKTTVKRVIHYLKYDLNIFPYEAIRANGLRSKSPKSPFSFQLQFEPFKAPYLELTPAIQICFFQKRSLNLRNYKIVFPDEYVDGYGV